MTVYGYACHAVLQELGPAWVERGETRVRFLAPCYEGEELIVSVQEGSIEVAAGERTCAVGTASTRGEGRDGLHVAPIPAAEAPPALDRPVASDESLVAGQVLGSVALLTDPDTAASYLLRLGEPAPLYRDRGIVHPGLLLEGANRVLMANVVMPAWLHVESEVQHARAVTIGEVLEVRGRVAEVFERKGHRFVGVDVTWLAGNETVAAAHHTAIWQLAAP